MGRGKPVPTRFLRFETEPKAHNARVGMCASPARGNVMPGAKGALSETQVLHRRRALVGKSDRIRNDSITDANTTLTS
jgi:hypothetical protein